MPQMAPGLCHPLRLMVPNGPKSTLYQWKKLKTRSNTPETAVVISPGVNFFRSKTPTLSLSVHARRGHTGN